MPGIVLFRRQENTLESLDLPYPVKKENPIARNQNTQAKRQREMDKKAKAEAKRVRRNLRKLNGPGPETGPDPRDIGPETLEDNSTEHSP